MPIFPTPRSRPPLLARALLLLAAAAALLATPEEAAAQSYRIRTITVGRATQFLRSDLSVAAERSFAQGVRLSAYDALGDRTGSLDLHLAARWLGDFGLPDALRDDPWAGQDWNEFDLEWAYARWRPLAGLVDRGDLVVLSAGRQWSYDALGMRDFDGLHARLAPTLGPGVEGYLEAWGGRDVQAGLAPLAADAFDAQGLPPNDDLLADGDGRITSGPWVFGGHAGLHFDRASVDLAWARRQYRSRLDADDPGSDATRLGEERIGAALAGNPHPRFNVAARASFHTLLGAIDRAGANAAWLLPALPSTLSAGVEHRIPIFDSASIFNLFGPQPYQGGWASYAHRVEALSTRFELRAYGRLYHGDLDAADLGADEDDVTTLGAAVGHDTRLRLLGAPLAWRSLLSHQRDLGATYGGDQLLADSGLRVPVWYDGFFVHGRGLLLFADPGEVTRDPASWAATGVVGVDAAVSFGLFSLAAEFTRSDLLGTNASYYASFTSEVWP